MTSILIAAGAALAGWLIPKGVAWLRSLPAANVHIAGHPKLQEALDALLTFGEHILQARVTEQVLDGIVALVKGGSTASAIGNYVVGQLGKPILDDVIAGAGQLIGTELHLVFGGSPATEQAALQRLGLAATKVSATPKLITTLADGSKLVKPAPAAG